MGGVFRKLNFHFQYIEKNVPGFHFEQKGCEKRGNLWEAGLRRREGGKGAGKKGFGGRKRVRAGNGLVERGFCFGVSAP